MRREQRKELNEALSSTQGSGCGACRMRVLPGSCTVVQGPISMKTGYCILWEKGAASTKENEAGEKATKEASGYEEKKAG